jgi:hypothetical protein
MKPIRMAHSDRCRRLTNALEYRRWCPGNGACMYAHCICANLRKDRLTEHALCEQRYGERVKALAHKTSGDGKSRAAGLDKEIS